MKSFTPEDLFVLITYIKSLTCALEKIKLADFVDDPWNLYNLRQAIDWISLQIEQIEETAKNETI